MKDISSKISNEDKENARLARERIKNPANIEPGMEDGLGGFDMSNNDDGFGDFGDWGSSDSSDGFGKSDGFGSSDGFGNSDGFGGSGGFGDTGGFGGSGGFDGGFGGGFGQPPKPPEKETEDKIFEALGVGAKGFGSFMKAFVGGFKTFDVEKRMGLGRAATISGASVAGFGVIFAVLGYSSVALDMVVGGLLTTGVAVPIFMFSYDSFKKSGGMDFSAESPSDFPTATGFDVNEEIDIFSQNEQPPSNDDNPSDGGIVDDDFFSFDDDFEENFDKSSDDLDFPIDTLEDTLDIGAKMDDVVGSLDANKGMLTRKYLFDKINECLPAINPKFNDSRVVGESTDEFDAWNAIVLSSSDRLKPKGNDIDMPYLVSVTEKLFYYHLEVSRVSWLKNVDSLVNEIVSIFRYDADTGIVDTKIYGIGMTVGDSIYIKIMKGQTAMVSIKDIYKQTESKILSSDMGVPIVLGVDVEGNPVIADFQNIQSFLVTGMPRSGKTWLVQSILAQMMFYASPSEMQFTVLDPKGSISDFRKMKMPHIRKFVSDNNAILDELRNVVKKEAPRRKHLIGSHGHVNIKDFKRANPDIDLPYMYVIIDEVITLSESMEKETKDEFQGLLLELVSQLPALGIRIIMIPHVVKDQVLKKSITDLIPCRISVCGDAEHIEKSTGKKGFKHQLSHQGDMALRINNDETIFVHSAILTDDNDKNADLFLFLQKFWGKLEPESLKGSWKEIEEAQLSTKQLLSTGRIDVDVPFTEPKRSITREPLTPTSLNSSVPDRRVLASSDVSDLLGTLDGNNQPTSSTKEKQPVDDNFDIFGGL